MRGRPASEDVGKKFGKLRVLCLSKDVKNVWRYLCMCDCGKACEPRVANVRQGMATSCGCRVGDSVRERMPPAPQQIHAKTMVLANVKNNAKKRGYSYSLTTDQCMRLFAGNCKYCGCLPSATRKMGDSSFTYNGIDRVDNSRGYEPDNVVSCCRRCNLAKHEATVAEFVSWARRLVEHQGAA